jgi:pimeloyl-ACP methyl ester carboxylesterase
MEQIPPDSYRRALRAVVGFDQRSALARIAVPALVIAGTHDKVSTPQVVRRMAERLPAGVYREIDAGHLAPFEEPATFAALVCEFLAGLDHIPVL